MRNNLLDSDSARLILEVLEKQVATGTELKGIDYINLEDNPLRPKAISSLLSCIKLTDVTMELRFSSVISGTSRAETMLLDNACLGNLSVLALTRSKLGHAAAK